MTQNSLTGKRLHVFEKNVYNVKWSVLDLYSIQNVYILTDFLSTCFSHY